MKTVTIPTCANPFVVIVNGIKYTYPAGATMEVPDDVAEVIEQHEEAKPEPAPVAPPFATGASSGGGGGDTAKVINLTDYPCAVLGAGKTFNDALLYLFSSGGGRLNFSDSSTFWNDVSTDSRVKFVVDSSSVKEGVTIEFEATNSMKYGTLTFALEGSFLTAVQGSFNVTAWFDRSDFNGTTTISILVTTVNFPDMG